MPGVWPANGSPTPNQKSQIQIRHSPLTIRHQPSAIKHQPSAIPPPPSLQSPVMTDAAPEPRPIVLLGPTAGGKSALAAGLAERLGGAVVSADSMQVYKHMDAGTAKPPAALRQRIEHHLIDIVEPTEPFTVADWLDQADRVIARLQAAGRVPIVVGGTNLYMKALLEGMFDGPGSDPAFRERLAAVPGDALHARVAQVDPDAAERISVSDRKRLIRALEVYHLTGRPITAWQRQWAEQRQGPYRYQPDIIGLRWPSEAINHRINRRVKAMFYPDSVEPELAAEACPNGESLPAETERLEQARLLGPQAREALGYKQVLRHLAGEWSLEDAFEQTKIQTRRFAKQQRTWMKRFRGVTWLDAAAVEPEALLARALAAARPAASSGRR
jgi:tRNA dimethylallyltransferase